MPNNASQLELTANAYNELLVPALFGPMARLVAEGSGVNSDSKVLDVGCGTGALTRQLAKRIGSEGRVTGLDANPGMIAVARGRDARIDWQLGDAAKLPFDDGAFDIVTSQFALMLFDDRRASLREMWRVLSDGGRLTVAVFDSLAKNRSYAIVAETYEKHVGADIANALRFPFSLGNPTELGNLFESAGIEIRELGSISVTAGFPNATGLVHADVKGWFPFAGLDVSDADIQEIARNLRQAFPDPGGGGEIRFQVFAHLVTAEKS